MNIINDLTNDKIKTSKLLYFEFKKESRGIFIKPWLCNKFMIDMK
jgi:hypothetical protein